MSRFGLRERIAVGAVAASAAALLAVLVLVSPDLRRRTVERTQDTLRAEARLMARVVERPLAEGASPGEIDALVDSAAREVSARVTIIAPDGRVLADSSLSGPELAAVENHGHRPEVMEALRGGTGSAIRRSATVDVDLLYAAVPIRHEGQVIGVARVALPLYGVEEQAREVARSVALALALAFAVAVLLSIALSAPLAGPLREMMQSAHRFAAGDLSARTRISRRDEIGELARILDRSADQLQARLNELAGERARTETILSAIDSGLLAVDHRGTVILANHSLRRSLDLPDALGRHYVEVIRHSEVGRALEAALRTGRPQALEVRIHHLRRIYALQAGPFPGQEGMPHGAVLTFQDVTERRRVDEMRRDFVANASHELRTPLTSIRGFVEALEDGGLEEPPTARRFLEKIRTHADRMAALVSDLLELSRLESGERPPTWERVPPEEVVDEVVGALGGLAAVKQIEVTTHVEAPAFETDRDRLRGVLENLVENALKYTPGGGHVSVTARADEGTVVFEVADDGPGIGAEHLPRVFERFYRVDKARSRELGGTGLGLSIVKHLVESLGGTVSVSSERGEGSRFSVRFPVARREAARTA
ncbi:MAG: HAMP domain-containing protein [Actinobacteria bacterium]|nr:MAG: HAMP domain-containing protein [Actinomycetota bacterium]